MSGNPKLSEKGKATRFKSGAQAVEMGKKGGIASQKKAKERKTMKAIVNMLLETPSSKADSQLIKRVKKLGYEVKDEDSIATLLGATLIGKAMTGDVKAIKMVMDLSDDNETIDQKIKKEELKIKKRELELKGKEYEERTKENKQGGVIIVNSLPKTREEAENGICKEGMEESN